MEKEETEETGSETVEKTEEKHKVPRRKNRAIPLAAAALILAVLVLSGIFAARTLRPKTQYELDRDALAGFLPNKTREEIEEELNRIIDQSRFNVSVNPTPVIEDGRINVMIENIPANHYWMQADVYIRDPSREKETLIYHSGIIKQGYYIETGKVEETPAPGQYNGRAVFTAVKPDSDEEIGRVEATMVVFVGEQQ